MKFKIGDRIAHIDGYPGFEEATVYNIDSKYYHVRIMNGIATIPLSAEVCYQKLR